MPRTLVTGNGIVVQLGRELGKGGEGSVYEVPTNARLVAKLYHRLPDAKKQTKLKFMAATADEQLLSHTAWPQETLHATKNGPIIGFLMPNVAGKAPIHMLYSPAHRRQDYPRATWDFLLLAARNTAAAFATLHDHGHILGDVNQGNVMVGSESKVVLIDCDSFQITAKGEMHLCKVGVSHFTPPELQSLSSFDGFKRSFNHDNFGLALLAFHLLFGGRHPYSGVPLRKDVGEALETDIKAFRFAYSRDAQSRGIAAPPNSIPLSLVPGTIAAMFELSFTERGASVGRPTAKQWLSAFDALRNHLRKCRTTSMHIYPDHLSHCPWCALENKGVIYFIDIGFSFTPTTTGFVLDKAWAIIEAVSAPTTGAVPTIGAISVTPTPLPPDIHNTTNIIIFRVLIICCAIGLFVAAPAAWLFIAIGTWIAWGIARSSGESERNVERNKRRAAVGQARREYEAIESRFHKECGPERFAAKKKELESLRDEYRALAAKEKSDIERLHATAEARQKKQFLERFFIDSASIPGVGPARKAALRSFGIETAADIDLKKVQAVKGFGDVFTRAVVDWRKSCERHFVFNPRNAVSEADKNAVRAKIANRRRILEAALSEGASELQQIKQETVAKAVTLNPELTSAAKKLAQAQADLNLL